MSDQQGFLSRANALANALLAGAAAAFVLLFAYVFYYYGWTGQRRLASPVAAGVYYGLPIVLAALTLIALRLKPVWKVNLVLVGLSVGGTLYLGEIALRLLTDPAPRVPAMTAVMTSSDRKAAADRLARKSGRQIDSRSVSEVIAELSGKGIEAVPIIAPSNNLLITEPDGSVRSALRDQGNELIPLGALSNRRTILCNEGGSYIGYDSDQYGFNNAKDVWRLPRIDVAALGDSFAQGYCVAPERNMVSLIRDRYPATVNLAMAGNGPLLELATLEEYLAPVKPAVVLWFYFEGNDLENLQKERSNSLLLKYLDKGFSQNLMARQRAIDQEIFHDIPREQALEQERRKVRAENERTTRGIRNFLLDVLRLSDLRQRLGPAQGMSAQEAKVASDLQERDQALFRDILCLAARRVSDWGGRLYFVYLPDWPRYKGGHPGLFAAQRDRVLETAASEGLTVIDLDPAFRAHGDPLSLFPFREPGHYTEEGHRLVAEEVLKVLKK